MISVAMATYNGEKYIQEQLLSILPQIGKGDEIIISDDGSTDSTLEIIRKINDKRIKIIQGPKNGIKQNFANAIIKCNGDIIFLADQDDIWKSEKVRKVLDVFKKEKCQCVIHDCEVFNSDNGKIIYSSFFKWRGSKAGRLKNIWKNSYIGCCMAFTSDMKKNILPIPNDIEMHDQWIGLMCEKYGKSIFLPEILLSYRRHGENQTEMNRHGMRRMLRSRVIFCKRMMEYSR